MSEPRKVDGIAARFSAPAPSDDPAPPTAVSSLASRFESASVAAPHNPAVATPSVSSKISHLASAFQSSSPPDVVTIPSPHLKASAPASARVETAPTDRLRRGGGAEMEEEEEQRQQQSAGNGESGGNVARALERFAPRKEDAAPSAFQSASEAFLKREAEEERPRGARVSELAQKLVGEGGCVGRRNSAKGKGKGAAAVVTQVSVGKVAAMFGAGTEGGEDEKREKKEKEESGTVGRFKEATDVFRDKQVEDRRGGEGEDDGADRFKDAAKMFGGQG